MMGKSKLDLTRIKIDKFDKGNFPYTEFDDLPDGGTNSSKHVLYRKGFLRPFAGMDLINSSQVAELYGSGIHYLNTNTLKYRLATFGTKLYWDNAGTWTDITGTITLTANNLVQFVDHQIGATEYVIGVNGTNAPFKWTGAGNAAVLGGTPPNFTSITKYHGLFFGSYGQYEYFSDATDPETWDLSKWVITFDKNIVVGRNHGTKIAVCMEDHIGSISGYTYLSFSKEETEINTFGCVGRNAIANAKFGTSEVDVLAVLSNDGLYIIDTSFGYKKIFGDDFFDEININYLSKACLAYDHSERLLYCTFPTLTATENDYLAIVNMKNGAWWKGPDIHANNISAMASCKDANKKEWIYFLDRNGYSYKFNFDTKNYHTGTETQAIDASWSSKKYDLKDIYDFREISCLTNISSNSSFSLEITFGLGIIETGISETIYTSLVGDYLDSTFVIGVSILSGGLYVFELVENLGYFGRYFSFRVFLYAIDKTFELKMVEANIKRRRMGYADK